MQLETPISFIILSSMINFSNLRNLSEEDDEKAKDDSCLMAQASSEICLGIDLEPNEWIKDIGCTKHMTGNQKLFSTYKAYNGSNVIFGSNLHGNIFGKESLNVTFNETPPPSKTLPLVDDDLLKEKAIKVTEKKNIANVFEDETLEIDEVVNIKETKNHPLENVIENLNQRTLRLHGERIVAFEDMMAFVYELESVTGVSVVAKTVMFWKEMMEKDHSRDYHLENLGNEAKQRAFEMEFFVEKLMREGSS
nr:retrotransposon protein [Tanacetum cinerariifolium]